MEIKSWNRLNCQELLTMVLMNYQKFFNGLFSKIVDHINCQIDYLFTRILNLSLKLFKSKNKSECKSNFFVSFYSKYFGLNEKLYQLLIKYNVRASACINFLLQCVNAHASTKIYHNSFEVEVEKYLTKLTASGIFWLGIPGLNFNFEILLKKFEVLNLHI